jgi:TPR repeat protein
MRTHVVVIAGAMLIASAAYAQSCQDGQAAFDAGNYAKALTIFEPLASKNDDCAQFYLGQMYMQGKGVPEDKAKAHEYFKKAAAQGNPRAKLISDFMERK